MLENVWLGLTSNIFTQTTTYRFELVLHKQEYKIRKRYCMPTHITHNFPFFYFDFFLEKTFF